VALAVTVACCAAEARPADLRRTEESVSLADTIVILRPGVSRVTSDQPDDGSFQTRNLANYDALETQCEVLATVKGVVESKSLKLVHFVLKRERGEFNGGMLMSFLTTTTELLTFPAREGWELDTSVQAPYATSRGEYLAFLRKLPDGRFAPAAPHYDAAGAFRLLSIPVCAQLYARAWHPSKKQHEPKPAEPAHPAEPSQSSGR